MVQAEKEAKKHQGWQVTLKSSIVRTFYFLFFCHTCKSIWIYIRLVLKMLFNDVNDDDIGENKTEVHLCLFLWVQIWPKIMSQIQPWAYKSVQIQPIC